MDDCRLSALISLDKDTARVVFQGTEGAYSQAAMEHYFGKGCNSYHVHTFREAMEAIEEGAADYAVLPIENSTAGAVNEIYDLLVEFENYIVGETIIPIKNTLSGLPGTDISEIERVYSKAEALDAGIAFSGRTRRLAADQCGEYRTGSKEDPGRPG